MNHFDDPANVRAYAALTEGLSSRHLFDELGHWVPSQSFVLELGMGPGHDLRWLQRSYRMLGTDRSQACVDFVRVAQPSATVQVLDARTLDIDQTFDAIYSNKVLDYLDDEALQDTFVRQTQVLRAGGIALHTFRHGDRSERELALPVWLRNERSVRRLLPDAFELLSVRTYDEQEREDSLSVVLRNTASRIDCRRSGAI